MQSNEKEFRPVSEMSESQTRDFPGLAELREHAFFPSGDASNIYYATLTTFEDSSGNTTAEITVCYCCPIEEECTEETEFPEFCSLPMSLKKAREECEKIVAFKGTIGSKDFPASLYYAL